MSATSTQYDDEDLLAEFDDLLDDTTAHSGSAVAGGTPVVASAEIQQRPVGAASAASTLAPAGVPRVATAEEAEAAFNFDPDAALAESRDHFDRLFAAAVSQRRGESSNGARLVSNAGSPPSDAAGLAVPAVMPGGASSLSQGHIQADADFDDDEDAATRSIRAQAARAASALGQAQMERRRAREQIRSGARATERAEFDRAISEAGSVWEVERLLKRRQEQQRVDREAAFERVRAAVAAADDDFEHVRDAATAAGGSDYAVYSAVLATTMRRAAAIRASTEQELADARALASETQAHAQETAPNHRSGIPSDSAAAPAGTISEREESSFHRDGHGQASASGSNSQVGSGMQHVLAGIVGRRGADADTPLGNKLDVGRPDDASSSGEPVDGSGSTDPSRPESLETALDEADRRVLVDTTASADRVHGAVLRQIQSAFSGSGAGIESSPVGGSGESAVSALLSAAGDGTDPVTRGAGAGAGAGQGSHHAGGPGGDEHRGTAFDTAGGQGLVGFLDERQGAALDQLLDELGVPVPGDELSGADGGGGGGGLTSGGTTGEGGSSELASVLAMLEYEARGARRGPSARRSAGRTATGGASDCAGVGAAESSGASEGKSSQ